MDGSGSDTATVSATWPAWMHNCAYCGDEILDDVPRPVSTVRTDDELEIYSFCDSSCQTAWNEESGRTDD